MTESKFDSIQEKFIKVLCIVIASIICGYTWRMHHESLYAHNYISLEQLEYAIKKELEQPLPEKFTIRGTGIELTKRADGSAILRIKGE